jgi:electron transfer flavoprotein beta subunit
MRLIVAMRQLADLVEELEVDTDGTDIDREFVKFVSNEWDEAALEEALLVKEATGGHVTVVALDEPDVDQTLYTALAKGADRAVKLTGGPEGWLPTRTRAGLLGAWLEGESFDAVLTGVQAADDLDGQLAGLLGARLGLPHAAVVVRVEPAGDRVTVAQELGGGTVVEEEITTPAVLGVQAARQAPRYAPITRIREAMKAGGLEEVPVGEVAPSAGPEVRRLFPPEKAGHAEMLTGTPADVAAKIVELIRARGLAKA